MRFETDSELVPQIEITFDNAPSVSLLDLAHRSADATVFACPGLADLARDAFMALKNGNAEPLCLLAPTSLVFGVWDSRSKSGQKRPRLVRAVVRAHGVDVLHAAAQFTSIAKFLPEGDKAELEKEAKAKGTTLSEHGLADAPGIFRKVRKAVAKALPQFRDGLPNPAARILGGIIVNGSITRDVTINLVALRSIEGKNVEQTRLIREYLLGLSLLAAVTDGEFSFREGCHLRCEQQDLWNVVPRRGALESVNLSSDVATKSLYEFTLARADKLKCNWPETLRYKFDLKTAKKLLAKKPETDDGGEG